MNIDNNPFFKPELYKRDLDVIKHANGQMAHYISRVRDVNYDSALKFVESTVDEDTGALPIKDPDVEILSRKENGDREVTVVKMTQILKVVQEKNMPMSPSMTIYDNPEFQRSILSEATQEHIRIRKVAKDARNVAEIEHNLLEYNLQDNIQQNAKIFNNSLSGAQVSESTFLFSPTAHSTLTSLCRCCSGYGNKNNEKFLGGSRHYWCADVVLAAIGSICKTTDRTKFEAAMVIYNLHYPTVEECMEMIKESSKYYWSLEHHGKPILEYLTALEPLERAMFMYVGDMYHLAMYNRDVVYNLIEGLSEPASEPVPNPEDYVKAIKGDLQILCNYNADQYLKRRKPWELKELDYNDWVMYISTGAKFLNTIEKYRTLIEGLWTTLNFPESVAELPNMVRRVVPASDTDSTIFTAKHWVEWQTGVLDFSKKANRVRDAVVFLASQSIVHYLAMMSVNIGVERSKMTMLGMKNEFTFDTFMITNATKHYTARQSAVEGSIMSDWKLELKGVGLKASTSPKELVDDCHGMIKELLTATVESRKVSMINLLTRIADKERMIIDSIRNNSSKYLKTIEIKEPGGYKNGEDAPAYKAHVLWNAVFAPSSQASPNLPYKAVRFNLDIANKTAMTEWLGRFEDHSARDRLIAHLKQRGNTDIRTLLVPETIANEVGIPEDIMRCADVRKTISNIMNCYYILLTGLRLYFLDDKNTNLVSDYY